VYLERDAAYVGQVICAEAFNVAKQLPTVDRSSLSTAQVKEKPSCRHTAAPIIHSYFGRLYRLLRLNQLAVQQTSDGVAQVMNIGYTHIVVDDS
jgi:hypothetical protein